MKARKNLKSISKYSGILLYLILGLSFVGTYIFGVSFLTNVHLKYIRRQAKDVVYLLNENNGGGTGFIIKAPNNKLVIMTNYHVCASTATGYLKLIYRHDTYLVRIIKSYELNDLCAVTVPGSITESMKLASSASLGERVYAIGHPLLEPIAVTEGEISSNLTVSIEYGTNVDPKDCTGKTFRFIDLTDNIGAALFGVSNVCVRDLEVQSSSVPILPGNSGSPLVNIYGNVVGVMFASSGAGVHSYLVPLEALKDFLSQL